MQVNALACAACLFREIPAAPPADVRQPNGSFTEGRWLRNPTLSMRDPGELIRLFQTLSLFGGFVSFRLRVLDLLMESHQDTGRLCMGLLKSPGATTVW